MKKLMFLIALGALFPVAMIAQSGTVAALARAGIDAGNQAWIDGVKTGNIALITATYAEDAVDCGPNRGVFPWTTSDRATHENSTYEPWKGARGCGKDVGIESTR
jgi:hypothetical protein